MRQFSRERRIALVCVLILLFELIGPAVPVQAAAAPARSECAHGDGCAVSSAADNAEAVACVISRIEALTERSGTIDVVRAQCAFASLTAEQLKLIEAGEQDRLLRKIETLLGARLTSVLAQGETLTRKVSDMLASGAWSDSTMLDFVRLAKEVEVLQTALLPEESGTAFDSLAKAVASLEERLLKEGQTSCGITISADLPWTTRLTVKSVTLSDDETESIISDLYFDRVRILSALCVRLYDYSDPDAGVREITSLPDGAVFDIPAGSAAPDAGERITLVSTDSRKEIASESYNSEKHSFRLSELTLGETLVFVGDRRVPIEDFGLQESATLYLDSEDPSVQLEIRALTPSDSTDASRAVFTSDNPSVAAVSADGRVTGLKKGSATITCEIMGVRRSCAVTVKNNRLTDFDSFWPAFRKNSSNMALTDVKLPGAGKNLTEKWIQEDTSTANLSPLSTPLQIGDRLYVASGKTLFCLDPETGDIEKSIGMSAKITSFTCAAYGDGMIFVPLEGGIIEAFSAETLESLWLTEAMGGSLSQITYHEGLLYGGTWSVGSKENSGRFFCVDTTKRIGTNSVRKAAWVSDDTKGYNRSGAVIVSDAVIFGGDSGVLQSRNFQTGELIDSYETGCLIRSAVAYDEEGGCVYFTACEGDPASGNAEGKIYRVRVNADGTFASRKSAALPAVSTTTPVVCNGRVYVSTGRVSGTEGRMAVLDSRTLQMLSAVDTFGPSLSSPLLTTAYAGDGSETVYLYITISTQDGAVVRVRDDADGTTPQADLVYRPENARRARAGASLTCSPEGVIYYANDLGHLTALVGTAEAVRASSVDTDPDVFGSLGLDSTDAFPADPFLTDSFYTDSFYADPFLLDDETIEELESDWDMDDDQLVPIAGSLTGGSGTDDMEVLKTAAIIISVIVAIIILIYAAISWYTQSGYQPKSAASPAAEAPSENSTENPEKGVKKESHRTERLTPIPEAEGV